MSKCTILYCVSNYIEIATVKDEEEVNSNITS